MRMQYAEMTIKERFEYDRDQALEAPAQEEITGKPPERIQYPQDLTPQFVREALNPDNLKPKQ